LTGQFVAETCFKMGQRSRSQGHATWLHKNIKYIA